MSNQTQNRDELHCDMSVEMMKLYSTLTEVNKDKVNHLIEILLNQQSNGRQSSDLPK